MRRNDRQVGSLRVLLILGLLVANIVAALPRHREMPQPPGKETASPAIARSIAGSSKGRLTFSPATSNKTASTPLSP